MLRERIGGSILSAELKRELEKAKKRIEELRGSLDLPAKERELGELEELMSQPGFWDELEKAQAMGQKSSALRNSLEEFAGLQQKYEDGEVLCELAEEGEEYRQELADTVAQLTADLDKMELRLLFSDKYDASNAIISLHPGAGGTESQDWTEMLLRMYSRWAENKGFAVETLDYLPGDEAGVKSVTLLIKGENAYGCLKAEKGVHRLVRISPFDASGRRHTSFSAVDVLPEVSDEDAGEIELDYEEIRVDTFRAGGAGGQHINKTESAVRMTHLPTGIVVSCQNERSQIQNRAACEKILKARLLERRRAEQDAEINNIRGEQQDIAWGSQIRSYVFHPYNMVKDHRTNTETGNVYGVMDGDLDPFIDAYLRHLAGQDK
ncbi:MAG: peptide chain release factor 2 [Clostridia bacterium]|nr:peptide chain release factor 2 [Clostridia bacterium]